MNSQYRKTSPDPIYFLIIDRTVYLLTIQQIMISYLSRKAMYGLLVMLGVVVLVFLLFLGFGDPSRLIMGQRADAATQENIRKELYLDQPKWKQFVFYLNDVSPISIYGAGEIKKKQLKGLFIGADTKLAFKFPY